MPPILDDIVAHKHVELKARQEHVPFTLLTDQVEVLRGEQAFRFARALKTHPSPRLILEIKPASPSAGTLAEDFDPLKILEAYTPYATALSVLTDERFFKGSFALLESIRKHTTLPILCKEFVIDPYQIYQARHAGADAVLLIVKILTPELLQSLFTQINALGMAAVVEVQSIPELEQALALSPIPSVLLINNRNLENFSIDFQTTHQLVQQLPKEVANQMSIISASGIETQADLQLLQPSAQTFLIGSSLMRLTPEAIGQKLAELTTP